MESNNSSNLIHQVSIILRQLIASPYPVLVSPADCPRRASVAFILRIQPSYSHWPAGPTPIQDLDNFFAQEWVQHGEPELLFIKRASRKGDRWTSHIALPGGKRDPSDEDDKAAAIRETWEEVGVDLTQYAYACGDLPQRLVTTHWGKKPLLVLCPYVFLLNTHQIPPLRLQPSEVAATHWVPLWSLLSPTQRVVAFEDVSSRLANQETGIKKWMCSVMFGQMIFAAIDLLPTESLHSSADTSTNDSAVPVQNNRHTLPTSYSRLSAVVTRVTRLDLFNQFTTAPKEGPLLLWGLTLGVVSDFLDLLPPHDALEMWTYPTFTPVDVRLLVWLMTYRFKARKHAELQAGSEPPLYRKPTFGGASESVASTAELDTSAVLVERPDETGLHGLGTGSSVGGARSKKAAVATMLEGWVDRLASLCLPEIADRARYYDIVRWAVATALVGRVSLVVVVAVLLWRRRMRRTSVFLPTSLISRLQASIPQIRRTY